MTFGHNIAEVANDPGPLGSSSCWKRIGDNLLSLGLLVGANVSQRRGEPKPVTFVTALKDVVNNDFTAVNIMLARIEEQNVMMRRQGQVITALQFRHLLEHLPRTLRGRKVTAAGDGVAGASVAMRWDQASEVERWLEFWEEAVKQVYAVYVEHETPARTLSPFAKLLEDYLVKAREKGDEAAAVRWLAHETNIGQHMKELYSTLSQIIHQFSDGKFTVDPLNFSPGDARLLAALAPEKSEDGTVDWKKEFRRYVWAKLETAGTARPEVKAEASSEDVLDRVKRLSELLRSNSPFPGLFNQLTDWSAKCNPGGAIITALYEPATIDIDSNRLLHSVVLAALVDLVGRLAVAASGASEQRVTGKRFEVKFKNLETTQAEDKIEVSGTASQVGKKKDQHWSTNVEMKAPSGAVIARGYFKAWEVEVVGVAE
jgi:hypothetical protein